MSNFKLVNDKMKNECHQPSGTCCVKCKYVSDGEDETHEWKACSESCLTTKHKKEFSYRGCNDCKHNTIFF